MTSAGLQIGRVVTSARDSRSRRRTEDRRRDGRTATNLQSYDGRSHCARAVAFLMRSIDHGVLVRYGFSSFEEPTHPHRLCTATVRLPD